MISPKGGMVVNKSFKKLFLAIILMVSLGLTGCAQLKTLTRHFFVKSADTQQPEIAGSTLTVETNAGQAAGPAVQESQAETEAAPAETEAETEAEIELETEAEETEQKTDSGEVSYQDANEVVYTSDSVNARNAPGPDGEIAKTVPAGTKLRRIGIGSDGWDKVDLNGELYYMAHDYLTTTAP